MSTPTFRLSEKVLLEKGDKIRISGGPYYLTNDGTKISLGEKGIGKFQYAADDGTAIYVSFESSVKYVYIGPEKVSALTRTIMKAHKIVKIRKQ